MIMTYGKCKKTGRKHTPIKSRAQFGMLEHLTSEGKISRKVMRQHELEAKGKKLPKYVRKKK